MTDRETNLRFFPPPSGWYRCAFGSHTPGPIQRGLSEKEEKNTSQSPYFKR